MLGLGMSIRNVMSNNAYYRMGKTLLKSSKALWDINYSNIRLRRDDDDFEKNFTPAGDRLDVSTIADFNSWDLLDGREYKDYLYDTPLGVDSDSNGQSDNWSSGSGVNNESLTIENGLQKIEIIENGTGGFVQFISAGDIITATAGDIFSLSVDAYIDSVVGDTYGEIALRWVDSGSSTIRYDRQSFTNETLENIKLPNNTAPAGTVRVVVYLFLNTVNTTDLGVAYFKNAKLVKNSFVENIGLLTQDDDSDGVANGWSDAGSGTFSVSSEGQRIISASTNTYINSESLEVGVGANLKFDVEIKGSSVGDDVVIDLRYFDASSNLLSSNEVSCVIDDDYSLFTTSSVAPANTSYAILLIRTRGNGDDFTSRNATLKQTNNSTYCTKIFDYSGNGNDATQSTASLQPRLINSGVFEVDGGSNYALSFIEGNKLAGTTGTLDKLTILLNVNIPKLPSETGNSFDRILRTSDDGISLFYNGVDNYQLKFVTSEGSTPRPTIPESELTTDSSMLIFNIYDKDKLYLYLGTELISTVDRDNSSPIFTDAWVIGSDVGASTDFKWTSTIVFDKVLTQSQIILLYNRLTNLFFTTKWLLNTDSTPVDRVLYRWLDNDTWNDSNNWKD